VTKGCLCSDKTIYQCMKMFKFKDLQSTMSFYGHCSFTYLWNMHLIQLHDGIHNATVVIRATEYAERTQPFCISPVRPSVCPHLSVHPRVDQSKTVAEDYAIFTVQQTHTSSSCGISFIQKFWRIPLSGASNKGGDGNELFAIALCVDISKKVQD